MSPVDLGLQYGFAIKCCGDDCASTCSCDGKRFHSLDPQELVDLADDEWKHLYAVFVAGDAHIASLSVSAILQIAHDVRAAYKIQQSAVPMEVAS